MSITKAPATDLTASVWTLVLYSFADTKHYSTKPNKSQVKGEILFG